MSLETQLYWGALGLAVLWFAVLAAALAATRNGTVRPGPATQEFGEDPERPALVALLANGWCSVDNAAAATLLDLAARGHLELRQPGNEPARTTVHLTGKAAEDLTPYERRVLLRTAERAGADGAPIGAIAFRAEERSKAWNAALRKEIVTEAWQRGISRPRFGPVLIGLLGVLACLPGAALAGAGLAGHHGIRGVVAAALLPLVPFSWVLTRVLGHERATPRGLERAGHWAGVQGWLRAHEEFGALPPAAVTVWDRYLGYGAALGVTSDAARLLGFDSGDKRRVWSSYGGTWRPVRIRYPRLHPGFGAGTGKLLQLAGATALVVVCLVLFAALRRPEWAVTGPEAEHSLRRAGLLLTLGWVAIALAAIAVAEKFGRWTLFAAFLATMPGNFASGNGWMEHAFETPGPLLGESVAIAAFSLLTVWYLVLAVRERGAPLVLTGEVLRVEPRKDEDAPLFLALDTGDAERTTAWALPARRATVVPGTVVRLTVSPATRTIRTIEAAAPAAV
ncbi:hypothetical protein GCM10020229_13410 [Kitasatospora albolonga]|uniref:DUF2207 family protein n=1 Tax=Kitasatospora albolonga TaxID=68173 RepID=UPI0031F0452E